MGEPIIRRTDVLAAVKEAGIAALVAFGLFVLLIGFRTDPGPTGALAISTRFGAFTDGRCKTVAGKDLNNFLRISTML